MNDEDYREFDLLVSAYYQDDSYYGPQIEKESMWLWEHRPSGIVVTDKEQFEAWLKEVVK